jgi:hypothetical protein
VSGSEPDERDRQADALRERHEADDAQGAVLVGEEHAGEQEEYCHRAELGCEAASFAPALSSGVNACVVGVLHQRTTMTGQWAWWATRSAVEPSR